MEWAMRGQHWADGLLRVRVATPRAAATTTMATTTTTTTTRYHPCGVGDPFLSSV